jgi:L-threonylcarbamoyladenylate synthase
MEIFKLREALKDKERIKLAKAIREGGILFYPTDTLYGIGCNASNSESVNRIRKAKGRERDKPFSVIAPSKEWIFENSVLTKENVKFIDNLLPGPYTVVVKLKPGVLKGIATGERTLGVRIPRDEFCDFIRSQGVPFVTTSANLSEEEPVNSVKNIPAGISGIIDYAIDAGVISGHPSRLFGLSGRDLEILRW